MEAKNTENNSANDANKKRKRAGRWGAPITGSSKCSKSNHSRSNNSVSEEEALASLLKSAKERDEERKPSRKNNNNFHPYSKNQSISNSPKPTHKTAVQQNEAEHYEHKDESRTNTKKELANFGLSGALATDSRTGNMYNGVLLKFSEPPEARTPTTRWRIYVFREGENIDTLHLSRQSAYLFGREKKVADIFVEHPSLSRQHCVLQFRAVPIKETSNQVRCKPYLMDLGTSNGTFINGTRLDEARYYELRKKDVITLGTSSREYVLLTENTT